MAKSLYRMFQQKRDEGERKMKLNVTISKTSRGDKDYLQIMSEDAVSVNVVLVAEKITVKDHRES